MIGDILVYFYIIQLSQHIDMYIAYRRLNEYERVRLAVGGSAHADRGAFLRPANTGVLRLV